MIVTLKRLPIADDRPCLLVVLVNWELHIPNNKVPGAKMGPIWGRQDPGGPHVGPRNLAIWDFMLAL